MASNLTGSIERPPGSILSANSTTTSPTGGKSFNYTLVVQVPIPFLTLNLNLDLLGDFILPALTAVGIPQAITYLTTNVMVLIQNIVDDATVLIRAIPEASVTIVVKVGPAIVLNIQLMAQEIPVIVPLPTFQLDLPNFAADTNLAVKIPFPAATAAIIYVPIPVPVIQQPLVSITGGQVTASATAQPLLVENQTYLPSI